MYEPPLFRDRSAGAQLVIGGVLPMALGAVAGILLGVSAGAYWAIGALAAVGGFMAGFEHADGWEGADRGFFAGLIYGTALLLAHLLAGTRADASLGSFPPLLAVITAIAGALLTAAGARVARTRRSRGRVT